MSATLRRPDSSATARRSRFEVDIILVDERREHVAGHQPAEFEVLCGRFEVVGVVAVVDGLFAVDQLGLHQFLDDAAALPRRDVEFLSELALVNPVCLTNEFEPSVLVVGQAVFGLRGTHVDNCRNAIRLRLLSTRCWVRLTQADRGRRLLFGSLLAIAEIRHKLFSGVAR